ncbi:Krueppel-like factor 12 isoform X2 [Phymastichus coffea]|uniref:Krueppel-like factor 12 isoform X2 n=1 Tax=Phymastichus coffea TaxID=108790 RepID=UPI00273B6B10|nr:Krueppel-like factor 12 isoform X2 [Phymastichus coffea]
MSLPNHNYDSSNCLKHLEQLVIRTTQLEHSIHLSDSFNGYSCVPNNTVVLFGENRQRNSTLLPDLSDGSNVMGQVSEVNPLPITSTGINTQFSVHSTSSIYSIQHVTQNQIPLQPWERNIDLISSSSYNMYDAIERSGTNNYCDSSNCLDELEQLVNRTTQSSQPSETGLCSMFTKSENRQTNKKNKTSSRQTVARVGNIFNEAENQVPNPMWPYGKPTLKKRIPCECPNCNVQGGNKIYSITGKLQHKCHIPGCGRTFDWPSILRIHLKTHSPAKPFLCTWHTCNSKFKRKGELK